MRFHSKSLLRHTAIMSCLSGLALAPTLAHGQSPEPQEASTGGQLDEIIVTAQKREQNMQDVPISISTISQETLARSQFSDIRTLGTIAPSVNFQGGFAPSATNFNIRGVGSYAFTGGIQPSVSLVIDGVPYARAGEFVTDLADIERVEVLRGPQGTLFGRNSTGGAINITRNRPTSTFQGEVEGSITTDDEYMIRGMVSGPLTENIRARVGAVYLNRDGHIKNYGPSYSGGRLGGIETYAFQGKLDIDVTPDLNFLLSGDYSNRVHGFSPQVATIGEVLRGIGPGGSDIDVTGGARALALGNGDAVLGQKILESPLKTAISSRGDDNRNIAWGLSLDGTLQISDSIRLKSITAYRKFTDDNNPDVDGTPADGDNLVMPIISVVLTSNETVKRNGGRYTQARKIRSDYFIQELRLEGNSSLVDWTAGAFYQNFKEDLKNTTPLLIIDSFNPGAFGVGGELVGGTPTPNDEYILSGNTQANSYAIKTYAAFGDVTFHLTDQLDVFGGIRWTREDISKVLNNGMYFSVLSIPEIGTRFNSSTRLLFTDDLPIIPRVVGRAKASEEFVSYRVGASYKITPDVSVYGTVSRGQVGPAAPISYTDNLSFLAPTVADNYEIGFKSELFDRRVRFNAAAFIIKVKDLQASALIPGTVDSTTLNAGDLDIKGFEADITAAVSRNITLGGSLVYLDAKIDNLFQPCFIDQLTAGTVPGCTIDSNGDGVPDAQDVSGRRATNTPKLAFNVYASFNFPLDGAPVDIYGLVNYSWKDDVQYTLNQDDLARQKAYGLLDFTLGVRDKDNRYELFVFGKNILDKVYVEDAFEAFGALGRRVVRAPRNAKAYFGIGAKYKF